MRYNCEDCGAQDLTVVQYMAHKSAHTRERMPQQAAVTPIPSKPPISSNDIQKKREELELARLDRELEQAKAGSSQNNSFDKLLQMQQQHHQQLMDMMQKQHQNNMEAVQKQNELQLKISQLEMGFEDEPSEWWEDLLQENLPTIIAAISKKQGGENDGKMDINPASINQKDVKGNILDYQRKIRSGEVSKDQAYEILKKENPAAAVKMTPEQFGLLFEGVKSGVIDLEQLAKEHGL